MKNVLLAFVAGVVVSFAFHAHTQETSTQAAELGVLTLTAHDAGGKTHTAQGYYTSMSFDGGAGMSVEFNSDQFLCSGFGN